MICVRRTALKWLNSRTLICSLRHNSLLSSSKALAALEVSENEEREKKPRLNRAVKRPFLILDHEQAGLLRKRSPSIKRLTRKKENDKLSILEGVDIEITSSSPANDPHNKHFNKSKVSWDILDAIESRQRKLLVFKSKVSQSQAVKSIDYHKPLNSQMSQKRFEQLYALLNQSYTIVQLQTYLRSLYGVKKRYRNKEDLITSLMKIYWKCVIVNTMSEVDDLIIQRIINVDTRFIYLLLLTENGKILKNFAHIGALVAVSLEENVIIIRATKTLTDYVELSLNKIAANISSVIVPMGQIIDNHTVKGSLKPLDIRELLMAWQRESAIYIEISKSNDDPVNDQLYIPLYTLGSLDSIGNCRISSLGNKRISLANSQLLFGLDYNPQIRTDQMTIQSNGAADQLYPSTDFGQFDWINKRKNWWRLQRPLQISSGKSDTHEIQKLDDREMQKLHSYLISPNTYGNPHNTLMKALELNDRRTIYSVSLGQLLYDSKNEGKKTTNPSIFQRKLNKFPNSLMNLPLVEIDNDDLLPFNIDHQERYISIRLIPNLATIPAEIRLKYQNEQNLPPLELWFKLNESDYIVKESCKPLMLLEDTAKYLQTPQLPYDYKFNKTVTGNLLPSSMKDTLDNISDHIGKLQPGLFRFLQNMNMNWKRLKNPAQHDSTIDINLTLSDGSESKVFTISYDYVSYQHNRIMQLKYKDRYLVQCSVVDGGFISGKQTHIDFLGGENLNKDEYGKFVNDVLEFV